jgi:hypothetical protein
MYNMSMDGSVREACSRGSPNAQAALDGRRCRHAGMPPLAEEREPLLAALAVIPCEDDRGVPRFFVGVSVRSRRVVPPTRARRTPAMAYA